MISQEPPEQRGQLFPWHVLPRQFPCQPHPQGGTQAGLIQHHLRQQGMEGRLRFRYFGGLGTQGVPEGTHAGLGLFTKIWRLRTGTSVGHMLVCYR